MPRPFGQSELITPKDVLNMMNVTIQFERHPRAEKLAFELKPARVIHRRVSAPASLRQTPLQTQVMRSVSRNDALNSHGLGNLAALDNIDNDHEDENNPNANITNDATVRTLYSAST